MDGDTQGWVYLLHYHDSLHHAQHYLGWTNDLRSRLRCHANGHRASSVLASEFAKRDIEFTLVRAWPGPLRFEKRLKKMKNNRMLCPVCNPNAWKRGLIKI